MDTRVIFTYQMTMLKLSIEALNVVPQGSIVKKDQRKKCY